MHELSIVNGIVDIAELESQKAGNMQIEQIELEIGKLAGVEIESLNFIWQIGTENTVLENAEKLIHQIEGKAMCLECNVVFPIQNLFDSCPSCNSYFKDILEGKEMKVKSITFKSN